MKNFNEYLTEMAAQVGDLDLEFIKRAEIVSSFNVTTKDFEGTKYKQEIQFLYNKHFFPKFDLSKTAKTLKEADVNRVVRELKSIDKGKFEKLLRYTPKGVGPGEVLMYFMVDDLSLGGGTSAGLDLTSGGKGYEMKAVSLGKDGYFRDFKIGGTVNVSEYVKEAVRIKTALDLPGRDTEIPKSQIAIIKNSKYKDDWINKVEKPFQKKAYKEYFGSHETIFAILTSPVKLRGEIFVKRVKENEIELEVITQGVIKPRIKK